MLQFLWNLRRTRNAPAREPTPEDKQRWAADPLSHPEIKRMRPRELADIPFPRPEPLPARQCRRGSSG